MKITTTQLRRLVAEEVARAHRSSSEELVRRLVRESLSEEDKPAAGDAAKDVKANKGKKEDLKGLEQQIQPLAKQLKMSPQDVAKALKAASTNDTSKGVELLALVKGMLTAGPDASKAVGIALSKIKSGGEDKKPV